MRRAGLTGLVGRRKRPRIERPDAIALDLVDRSFGRSQGDQLWVTDITEHPTREGRLYRCVVLDVFSRRVVGWSIDASPTAALVTNALGMAINSRNPDQGTLIHSDHPTSSLRGRSRTGPRLRGWCRRWDRSATATTAMILGTLSVAYIVCDAIGFDSGDYSFAYVARWAEGSTDLLKETGERVIACAKEILVYLESTAANGQIMEQAS